MKRKNFDDICNIVKGLDRDVMVIEKYFDVELNEAIERDSKRTGTAHVGEVVIKRMWKEWKNVKTYTPRTETFVSGGSSYSKIETNPSLEYCVLCDLDGSLAIMGNRSPYDASNCDIVDSLNEPLAEILLNFHNNGYKIVFMSGRQDKDEAPTRRFIDKHLSFPYELYMRKTGDQRKDSIVKEELFNTHIKGKYNCWAVFDDRLQVCQMWYKLGLNLFRIGNPDSNF